MKNKKPYYDIMEDIKAYPKAWCFIICGGRKTGKTYGALKAAMDNNLKHVFLKRCNNDVNMLCAGNHLGEKGASYEVDLSPYKALNRDTGEHIKAYKIDEGLGGFYRSAEDGSAGGAPVGYLLSLAAIHKFKGFDLSECDWVVFDEFIPQPWERVNRKEGEQVMDLYMTVARDRHLRGKPELKLLCLANAVNVFNYTCEALEVTDIIADMTVRHQEIFYDEDRGIFIRLLKTPEEMIEDDKKTGIYKAMHNTAWGRVAFDNEFAYNDFTNVGKIALKSFKPMIELKYKNKRFYIYISESKGYYMTLSPAKCPISYDLNTDTGQIGFYYDYAIDLRNETVTGRMMFEKYTMYDMIINYKKRFKV